MKKKITGVTLWAVLFALCLPVEAQQTGKIRRIGYLGNEKSTASEEAFLQGLRERKWIEGQNIIIERRYWENRTERLAALADELVRLKMDVHRSCSPSRKEGYPHYPHRHGRLWRCGNPRTRG